MRGPATLSSRWLSAGLLSASLLSGSTALAEESPFRVDRALGSPEWLDFGLDFRVRAAQLLNEPRSNHSGDVFGLSTRLLAHVGVDLGMFGAKVEIEDARIFGPNEGGAVTTSLANPLEVLQAYVELAEGGGEERWSVKLGRLTLDVGSRRFVARNGFRNTINGFTGLDAEYATAGHGFRFFAVMPVARRPTEVQALLDGDIELDEEQTDTVFTGLMYLSPTMDFGLRGEVLLLGLVEGLGEDDPAGSRRLFTPTFRVVGERGPGRLDYTLEGALQVGKLLSASGEQDLLAHFLHADLGFSFDTLLKPRLQIAVDWASGDHGYDSSVTGFDTLYGSRRFDFGPTGLYGLIGRTNLRSPEARLEVSEGPVDGFFAFRGISLDTNQDAFSPMGWRDSSGRAGEFVGHQIELRLRWEVLPGNLRMEGGFAHAFLGRFAEEVVPDKDDPSYLYLQVSTRL